MSERDTEILNEFCHGMAPSAIDRRHMLVDGTARTVIVGWWSDDKLNRTGCSEMILGRGWRSFRLH